jgi:hypothetical protein
MGIQMVLGHRLVQETVQEIQLGNSMGQLGKAKR